GAAHLYAARLDGSVRPVTSGRYRFSTAYAAGEPFSISPGGQVAMTRSTLREPSDVFTFPVDQPARATRLTAANDSLLADRKLGEVEEFPYKSFDGRTIQAWIVKPPDFNPARKYPLIL